MDSHERHVARIAEIEGVGRAANEVIARENAPATDGAVETFRCECGDDTCAEALTVPRSVYEQARSDPMQFIVRPGHIVPEAETVKEKGDGFWILYKNEEVRPIVETSDPRS